MKHQNIQSLDTRHTPPPPSLPMVSVIIVNFNYGRFISQALESIAAQTYPFLETIVVDDRSTDESWATICALTAPGGMHPNVLALQTPTNGGQSTAAAYGLAHSRGTYVIFVDADDILLPRCVEAHVYAHLSSRIPVGFSAVDNFTIVDGQYVTSSAAGSEFAKFVASGQGALPAMIRSIDRVAPDTWFGEREPVLDAQDIHLVRPPKCEPWIWSPTSAICFRRDALVLFLNGPKLADMRWGTDAYLMRPISAICGSMLIDRPLMGYRIHGTNCFAEGAPLNRLRNFDVRDKQRGMVEIMKNAVRKMFDDVESFGHLFGSPEFYFEAVRAQCLCWPGLKAEEGGKDFLTECLLKHEAALVRTFGPEPVGRWLVLSGARRRPILRELKQTLERALARATGTR